MTIKDCEGRVDSVKRRFGEFFNQDLDVDVFLFGKAGTGENREVLFRLCSEHMGRHIDKTPLLYSVGTKLAYRINKRYYKDVHYVWCADSFNSKDQPPTSNPYTIIKRYLEQISSGDRHTKEIDNNVAGILKGAKAKLDAGVITKKQYTAMGDASANKAYDIAGDVIDVTKVVADTGQFICNIANLGVVKDFRYKPGTGNKGYSFTWDNIKRNILHDMNIYTSKIGKKGVKWYETVNWKEAFDIKSWFGGYSSGKFKIDGKFVVPDDLFKVFNITKIVKNTTDTFENFSDIGEALSADEFKLGDLLKPLGDLTSIFSPVEKPVEYVTDTADTIKDWRYWFKGAFDSPDELDKETIQGWFDDAFEGTVLEQKNATAGA